MPNLSEFKLARDDTPLALPPAEGTPFRQFRAHLPELCWYAYELLHNGGGTSQYVMCPHPQTHDQGWWFLSMEDRSTAKWVQAHSENDASWVFRGGVQPSWLDVVVADYLRYGLDQE